MSIPASGSDRSIGREQSFRGPGGRPLVIAHRGACGYRPEHTSAAYDVALAMGADAVEPDIVPTRDGVLVVQHENELSATTDIAEHSEFAERRTVKRIEGVERAGWFTEDFTWEELRGLRAVERFPGIRPLSASFDGQFPLLRLGDLREFLQAREHRASMVIEVKHATYFDSIGLPVGELLAAEVAGWAAATAPSLIIESFERTVLADVRRRGVEAHYVFLVKAAGSPADLVARSGADALSYADHLASAELARLADEVHGISVNKKLLADSATGAELIDGIHAAGLGALTWTLRAENRFLPAKSRLSDAPGGLGNWRGHFAGILATGVDGVFADQPDLALIAAEELRRR